jgi:MFS family permease
VAEFRPSGGRRHATLGPPLPYPPRVVAEPLTDPHLPPAEATPTLSLWRNGAFARVWTAATISIFGSLLTRMALPFVAILVLSANAFDVALVRSMDLIAILAVGLVAGAWVDRLRRRPVMIAADLGRALLLATIPLAAIGGWLSLPQLLLVAFLAATLTTFFDAADRAYLPTIVPRRDLLRANGALSASSSVSEFLSFGSAGFLVQLITGPMTIAIDALTYLISAVLLGSIRAHEPAPPPKHERRAVLHEIAVGVRLVARHPIVRANTIASMAMAGLWGIFGATWYLFALDDLGLGPAAIGIIAAMGGVGSLVGALLSGRMTNRFGVGRVMVVSLLLAALGNLFMPLAPSGAPLIAAGFLIVQQLLGDSTITVFDITEVSLRQTVIDERELGRVNATFSVAIHLAQLVFTLAGGALALVIGLRATVFLTPLGAVLAALLIWLSPVARLRTVEDAV